MSWLGKWRNQYGSILDITDESHHKIVATFRTALGDSTFAGQDIAMIGAHQGDCIGMAGGGPTPVGDVLVTYTGLLREGKLQTLWYVVADSSSTAEEHAGGPQPKKVGWWRAVMTNADTFERIA